MSEEKVKRLEDVVPRGVGARVAGYIDKMNFLSVKFVVLLLFFTVLNGLAGYIVLYDLLRLHYVSQLDKIVYRSDYQYFILLYIVVNTVTLWLIIEFIYNSIRRMLNKLADIVTMLGEEIDKQYVKKPKE